MVLQFCSGGTKSVILFVTRLFMHGYFEIDFISVGFDEHGGPSNLSALLKVWPLELINRSVRATLSAIAFGHKTCCLILHTLQPVFVLSVVLSSTLALGGPSIDTLGFFLNFSGSDANSVETLKASFLNALALISSLSWVQLTFMLMSTPRYLVVVVWVSFWSLVL